MRDITAILEGSRGPVILGVIIGILAAGVQGLTISAGGPEAYGFCALCHTRDLVNGLLNAGLGTTLGLAAVSKAAILPVMSMAGVLIGGFVAAKLGREFRLKTAQVFGACPYRAALRLGYGEFIALIGILGIIAGVWCALTMIMRSRGVN